MMAPPTSVMVAIRTSSAVPTSPASPRRGRRNAMADVTVGITADQLQTLEETVQTFVPDFFNPSLGDGGSSHRRNAVANVVEGLSHDDLHHLADMVRTGMTTCHHYDDDDSDDDTSSGDGEDACYSPIGPEPAYYRHRRNALAHPLANLDYETLRRIQSLQNTRHRSLHPERF